MKTVDINWQQLEAAHGPGTDLPGLIASLASPEDLKFNIALSRLQMQTVPSDVLYPASPPVMDAVVECLRNPQLDPRRRPALVKLVGRFAGAARQSLVKKRIDTAWAVAIRASLAANAAAVFQPLLNNPDPECRAGAVEILLAFAPSDPSLLDWAETEYFRESDARVRTAMIAGLARSGRNGGYVERALDEETQPIALVLLHRLWIQQNNGSVADDSVAGLVSSFRESNQGHELNAVEGQPEFFEALSLLGPERERCILIEALREPQEASVARVLAQQLLCLTFEDHREDWSEVRLSADMLPTEGASPDFMMQQQARFDRPIGQILGDVLKGMFQSRFNREKHQAERRARINAMVEQFSTAHTVVKRIDYPSVAGAVHPPERLTAAQAEALNVLAGQASLWTFRTNLWTLFGLPDQAGELREWVTKRTL